MDDKSTLFAALVCALAIVVVLIAEHRPSFFWWRYLFGLKKISPDEMEWNEVLQRIRKRTQRAFEREPGSKVLSNGVYAEYHEEEYPGGNLRQELTLWLKRQNMLQFPFVVNICLLDGTADITGIGANEADDYQWMMEQIGAESCYEIAKRAYICEQGSHRGQTERAKVEHEYIQWIARKFI